MLKNKALDKLALFSFGAMMLTSCVSSRSVFNQKTVLTNNSEINIPTCADVNPLPRAYAHNDYKHSLPFYDARDNGFSSVEADIFLVGNELYVAHTASGIRPGRTLENLYLKPLEKEARQNGGSIFPHSSQNFLLLVDVKSGGMKVHRVLQETLKKYASILTRFTDNGVYQSAVTVLISGSKPPEAFMKQDPVRYAAFDGRLHDLKQKTASNLIPLISANWNTNFSWRGVGAMTDDEENRLREIVQKAHHNGQEIRFWATPDKNKVAREAVWQELTALGVDYINTDHLPELREWLLKNDPSIIRQNNKKIDLAAIPH